MASDVWKVLIADDEPKIRRGLHAQIDRMGLPLTVCGEAEDGEIALAMAEQLKPDVCLVDINMPFMNGLDFIRTLKRTRADVRVILITGYEEFEYARSALELNVQAYLLKPIETEKLRQTLNDAIGALVQARGHRRHFEWAIAQIAGRRGELREQFLQDIVMGRMEREEIADFKVYFDFPTSPQLKLMLMVFRGEQADVPPWQHLILQLEIQDALKSLAAAPGDSCLFADDSGNVLLLYDAATANDDALAALLKAAAEAEGGQAPVIAIEALSALEDLSQAYERALPRVMECVHLTPLAESAERYIRNNYADPELSLGSMAAALNVHPAYLSRVMKQELGMSFSRFLTRTRITEAARLMRNPALRVHQISEMVGYSAANYFSAAFKKVLGVSPAEYRMEERTS